MTRENNESIKTNELRVAGNKLHNGLTVVDSWLVLDSLCKNSRIPPWCNLRDFGAADPPQVRELLPAYLLNFREAVLLAIRLNLVASCEHDTGVRETRDNAIADSRGSEYLANERVKPLAAWSAETYSPSVLAKTLYHTDQNQTSTLPCTLVNLR